MVQWRQNLSRVRDAITIINRNDDLLASRTKAMIKLTLDNAELTHQIGVKLGSTLPASTVILLFGDLGAGKTTLVKGIGEGLGITDPIVSPTFTLINEYTEARIPLYHLDLYRLEPNEVLALNLETYWEGIEVTPGIVAIEWAERMPYKPDSYINIHLSHTQLLTREITITPFNTILDYSQNSLNELQQK